MKHLFIISSSKSIVRLLRNCINGVLIALSIMGCDSIYIQRTLLPPPNSTSTFDEIRTAAELSPFLKAHMINGNLYLFDKWIANDDTREVSGSGTWLNQNRAVVRKGEFTIGLDSVAIFETNIPQNSPEVSKISLLAGVSLTLTAICITNPKACFGSCPTFYAKETKGVSLVAEGFSSSVAPSLEAVDVDALYNVKPTTNRIELQLKNEALETHVIRYAHLLAVPQTATGRVGYATDGTFWQLEDLTAPESVQITGREYRRNYVALDTLEQFGVADATNLATSEYIDLYFSDIPEGNLGLLIGARQSLLTTFLFYQQLAYMGSDIGNWMAILETSGSGAGDTFNKIPQALGQLVVQIQNTKGQWEEAGTISEVGPLATDVHLIRLPVIGATTRHIRLKVTRGMWRLNYTSLARVKNQVKPVRIPPEIVSYEGGEDLDAKNLLSDTTHHLVTQPGDEYQLTYVLPEEFSTYEYFLESKGYYLEWMREDWYAEESRGYATEFFTRPEKTLKRLAPKYKAIEDEMEEIFWRSQYAKP